MKKLFIVGLVTALGICDAYAQQKEVTYNLKQLLSNKQLVVKNREANALKDKPGIKLSAKENDGVAWLKQVIFANGTIELDMKGRDVLQQSFLGIAFHGNANTNMDIVYFRPFNFRTTDSVRKIHAVQYVSLPLYDWELLREKYNGQYEKAVHPAPKADEWFHAKIIVKYPKVKVYVNGSTTPSLDVKTLSTARTGKIGLWVGNNSDGEFANLSVVDKP